MVKLDMLRGIPEFVATAEGGSFSAAADATETSIANISRKVSALEKRLQHQLFLRTARGCTLTEAGQNFYRRCRGLLDGLEESCDEMRSGESVVRGPIRISLAGYFSEQYILPLLAQFGEEHEAVSIDVNVTARNVEMVAENIDLAIRLGPLADSTLKARKLLDVPLRTLISPRLLTEIGNISTPDDLPADRCLELFNRPWHYGQGGASKMIQPEGRFSSDNGLALVAAAKRGLGAIQVPSYYGQAALDQGDLVSILDDWNAGRNFEFYVVFPFARYIPHRVRVLADYLKAEIQRQKPWQAG